jgi:hypothetical protein
VGCTAGTFRTVSRRIELLGVSASIFLSIVYFVDPHISHLKSTHHIADTRGSSARHRKVASSTVVAPHPTHVALPVDRTHSAAELRVADIHSESHAVARKDHKPCMGERDKKGTSVWSLLEVKPNNDSTQHPQQISSKPKKTTTPTMSHSPTTTACGASSSTGQRSSTRSTAPWRARSSPGCRSGPSQTWPAL